MEHFLHLEQKWWSYEVCVCVSVCVCGGGGRVDTSLYWVTHTGTEERERERDVYIHPVGEETVYEREKDWVEEQRAVVRDPG